MALCCVKVYANWMFTANRAGNNFLHQFLTQNRNITGQHRIRRCPLCRQLPLRHGGDVGVGVESEASVAVTQYIRNGFDIHTVLQRQGGGGLRSLGHVMLIASAVQIPLWSILAVVSYTRHQAA